MLMLPSTRTTPPPRTLELDEVESGRGKGARGSTHGDRDAAGPLSTEVSPTAPLSISPDNEHFMQIVKVILLGAPAVGKTSIIQQFVWNEFSDHYFPTEKKQLYYPTVIINDNLYEININDIPVISYFPVNSFYEWTDFRFYGLRSATAYILVYDLSNAETFQYIRTLREQMIESRDMKNVPVLVVGNKQDLVTEHHSGYTPTQNSLCLMEQGLQQRLDYAREKRDIVNIVKKHWKCAYVECSAKYNWRVVAVFKELMKAVDLIKSSGINTNLSNNSNKDPNFSSPIDNFHNALDRNKCIIL